MIGLLEQAVEAAKLYPSIKRVLVWGSFSTDKPEPNDLDYSIIVSVDHYRVQIQNEHRRLFVPLYARQYYGVDRYHLVLKDYPLEEYAEGIAFMCLSKEGAERGIVEINIRGGIVGD